MTGDFCVNPVSEGGGIAEKSLLWTSLLEYSLTGKLNLPRRLKFFPAPKNEKTAEIPLPFD